MVKETAGENEDKENVAKMNTNGGGPILGKKKKELWAHLRKTQVPSKIIYIISLMNTVKKKKKKRTSPHGYKLTHYIVTGGEIHRG